VREKGVSGFCREFSEQQNLSIHVRFDGVHKHVSEIQMTPAQNEGKGFNVAEGNWDLGGGDSNGPQLQYEKEGGQYFQMVAGAGFEPATFGL
jgi:hypothetical protein